MLTISSVSDTLSVKEGSEMDVKVYLSSLEDEIGEIVNISEWSLGVYHVDARKDGPFLREYFAVPDSSPIAARVRRYGERRDGLRLFDNADDSSGWQIVQYEIMKYNGAYGGKPVAEAVFRDVSLHAMELYPEYFGLFPVPFHTPHGYTLRHRTLSNGVYWLETSQYRELLAICFPIWNARLSAAALMGGERLEIDKAGEADVDATPYLFFSRELSCVPLYELLATHEEWRGTVIRPRALMNALWEYTPAYAMYLNGGMDPPLAIFSEVLRAEMGCAMPEPDGKHVAAMFPGEGTDFLLLE